MREVIRDCASGQPPSDPPGSPPPGPRSNRRGERRMVALGIEPELIEEAVAAAVAGMPLGRFQAECRLPAVLVGKARLLPLDEVRAWAKSYWRRKTGGGPANDEIDDDARAWLDSLPTREEGEASDED